MIFKKISTLINGIVGLVFVASVAAQETPPSAITLTPSSGQFLVSQKFDIALALSPEVVFAGPLAPQLYDPSYPYSRIQFHAFVNGVDATTWFNECLQEHQTIPSGEHVLLCKAQDYSPFVEGSNDLQVFIQTGYAVFTAQANFTFVKSQRIIQPLPRRFIIQGTSFNTAPGVVLALNDRVIIRASGSVNLWPSNPSFPISSPRGTQICVNPGTCILPGAPVGALLVKIGTYGRWIVAGDNYTLIADRPGELIFAVNDKTTSPGFDDNLGGYLVTITK
jgi:hypothetical protein